jgi:ABC-type arginine transport system ATPase subunit
MRPRVKRVARRTVVGDWPLPKVTEEVFARIQDIRTHGVTVLVVEQNVVDGLTMANRGYVVENGRVTMQGAAADLLRNDKIPRGLPRPVPHTGPTPDWSAVRGRP